MSGLNIRDEPHIQGFPGRSDDVIVIDYCILYAKQSIYLQKDNKEQNALNIDFLSYLSQLKYKLKIEKTKYLQKSMYKVQQV